MFLGLICMLLSIGQSIIHYYIAYYLFINYDVYILYFYLVMIFIISSKCLYVYILIIILSHENAWFCQKNCCKLTRLIQILLFLVLMPVCDFIPIIYWFCDNNIWFPKGHITQILFVKHRNGLNGYFGMILQDLIQNIPMTIILMILSLLYPNEITFLILTPMSICFIIVGINAKSYVFLNGINYEIKRTQYFSILCDSMRFFITIYSTIFILINFDYRNNSNYSTFLYYVSFSFLIKFSGVIPLFGIITHIFTFKFITHWYKSIKNVSAKTRYFGLIIFIPVSFLCYLVLTIFNIIYLSILLEFSFFIIPLILMSNEQYNYIGLNKQQILKWNFLYQYITNENKKNSDYKQQMYSIHYIWLYFNKNYKNNPELNEYVDNITDKIRWIYKEYHKPTVESRSSLLGLKSGNKTFKKSIKKELEMNALILKDSNHYFDSMHKLLFLNFMQYLDNIWYYYFNVLFNSKIKSWFNTTNNFDEIKSENATYYKQTKCFLIFYKNIITPIYLILQFINAILYPLTIFVAMILNYSKEYNELNFEIEITLLVVILFYLIFTIFCIINYYTYFKFMWLYWHTLFKLEIGSVYIEYIIL